MRCQPKDIRSFILSYDSATLWKTSATRSVFSASDRPSSKPKCVVLSDEVEVLLLFVVGFCAAIDVLKGLAERMEEQEQEKEGRKVRVAARKTGRADIFAIPDPRNVSTSPCLRSFRVQDRIRLAQANSRGRGSIGNESRVCNRLPELSEKFEIGRAGVAVRQDLGRLGGASYPLKPGGT